MSRGGALAAGAVLALAWAGCGGSSYDGGGAPSTRSAPPRARPAPTIDARAAIGEARSAASQGAFRQDYSIPPPGFAAACRAQGDAARARTWSCRVRARDRPCAGRVKLVVAGNGAVVPTFVTLRCTGSSARG